MPIAPRPHVLCSLPDDLFRFIARWRRPRRRATGTLFDILTMI
jgi:hypothetical protein